MEELHGDARLYRIVKTWDCPSGNISDLRETVFSARKEKKLSLYLSTVDTPKEALKNYRRTTETDKSQIVGVVAVTAGTFHQFNIYPKCDGHPVPSHVTAAWETNEHYKDMKDALTDQAIGFGWQLGPLLLNRLRRLFVRLLHKLLGSRLGAA